VKRPPVPVLKRFLAQSSLVANSKRGEVVVVPGRTVERNVVARVAEAVGGLGGGGGVRAGDAGRQEGGAHPQPRP